YASALETANPAAVRGARHSASAKANGSTPKGNQSGSVGTPFSAVQATKLSASTRNGCFAWNSTTDRTNPDTSHSAIGTVSSSASAAAHPTTLAHSLPGRTTSASSGVVNTPYCFTA